MASSASDREGWRAEALNILPSERRQVAFRTLHTGVKYPF